MLNNNILVIEDDKDLSEVLEKILSDEGYSVNVAHTGARGLNLLDKSIPDLVLLDLMLPDMQGENICKEIKKLLPELPVIMLTAKHTTDDIVRGLNIGADDYIAKPFETDELLARIHAKLRPSTKNPSVLKAGDVEMNLKTIKVTSGTHEVKLTPREFGLLEYLLRNKGRVLTREMILNKVWSYNNDIESRVVDVYVGYLRKKINHDEENSIIKSVPGFGYTIEA
jgi:DNA-binding response OmpR family regulator